MHGGWVLSWCVRTREPPAGAQWLRGCWGWPRLRWGGAARAARPTRLVRRRPRESPGRVSGKHGGPRGGSGAPAMPAMCARTAGCRACASAWGTMPAPRTGGEGREMPRHTGQSSVPCAASPAPSSSGATHFMAPPVLQTISDGTGRSIGDAMATPSARTNHAMARRTSRGDVRRTCMATHYGCAAPQAVGPPCPCGNMSTQDRAGHWPGRRAPALPRQLSSREDLGTCAMRNSIWSARMRRLRRMKSSHRLGT